MQELFNMWLDGVEIIISFIPIAIGLIVLPILLFASFDLITFSIFGDMMFAETFLPKETYKKLYDYLSKK